MPDPNPLPSADVADTRPPDRALGPGYEVRDVHVRTIVVFVAGLFLFMAVAQAVLWGMLKGISSHADKPEPFTPASAPEVITDQLRRLRAEERSVLAGKAPAGKASQGKSWIPIDRAIDLLAERGVPPTPGPPRTEEEVNGHAGTPVPEEKAAAKGKGAVPTDERPRAGERADEKKQGGPK